MATKKESRRITLRFKVVIGAQRQRKGIGLEETVRVVGGEIDKMISQDKMVRHIYNDYYVIGTILDISYHNSLGQ